MIAHPLSDNHFMIRTGERELYDKYCSEFDLFEKRHNLFSLSLVYGLLFKLKSEKTIKEDMVYIDNINDEETTLIIDCVGYLLDDGQKDEKILWKDMLEIADGGLQKLHEIYEKNGDFTLPELISKSTELWKERAKHLNNISL